MYNSYFEYSEEAHDWMNTALELGWYAYSNSWDSHAERFTPVHLIGEHGIEEGCEIAYTEIGKAFTLLNLLIAEEVTA